MASFVVFDANTGAILRTGTCAEGLVAAQAFLSAAEVSMEAVADMRTDYVVDIGNGPEVLSRPILPELVEGPIGTWTATGCPAGMTVEVWDRELGTLIDSVPAVAGAISITLADPGPYLLASAVWPYLPQSLEVDVG